MNTRTRLCYDVDRPVRLKTSRLVLLFGGLSVLLILFSTKAAVQPLRPVFRPHLRQNASGAAHKARKLSHESPRSTAIDPAAVQALETYFPQIRHCNYDRWGVPYAELHADIVKGRKAPRFLVSVATYAGMADRITGAVTQFYLALLSQRAFTMVTHNYLPPFEAACAQPYINWTQPHAFPSGVLTQDFLGAWDGAEPDQLPDSGPVNRSTYFLHSMLNTPTTPDWVRSSNLSRFPPQSPDVPYIMSLNNRGETYAILNNPHHKQQWLEQYGLTTETAFMCSMFYLCAPNKAARDLFQPKWKMLRDDKVLKIGIKVRLGDTVYAAQNNMSLGQEQLAKAAPYFECAQRLEQTFAAPGQKVVWYLITDALPLRVAAAKRYSPDKLLTDTTSPSWHTDCFVHNAEACDKKVLELSTQQALGEMLTFSMTDYQIMPSRSGFGRVGAWLSGKLGNMFEFDLDPGLDLSEVCDPHKPTPPHVSATSWSRIL